jgi:AraC-like DNA-binding protein
MSINPSKNIANSSSYLDSNVSLTPYYCGHHTCPQGHYYGPITRDHYLIHYVLKGKGIFQIGKETYHLEKGQGFLICPNDITYYKADDNDPWEYRFFGFHGIDAEACLNRAKLNSDNPVFIHNTDDKLFKLLDQMLEIENMIKGRDIMFTGLLYQFLSILIEDSDSSLETENRKEQYVKKAITFIHRNYSNKTIISEIARFVRLERKYLTSVFKSVLGISPQEYLIKFRINRACQLMANKALTIGDIARSVGYNDPFLFSKIFKKFKGCSPKEFRDSL